MTVNQKELAECLGISARRVRQLQQEGILQRDAEQGGYDLEKCSNQYFKYRASREEHGAAASELEQLRAEHEKIKTQIAEIQYKRMKGELYLCSNVEEFFAVKLTRFRNDLKSLPAKIAMTTGGLSAEQAEEVIRGYLEAALDELSGYNPEEFDFQNPYYDYNADEDDEDDEDDGYI